MSKGPVDIRLMRLGKARHRRDAAEKVRWGYAVWLPDVTMIGDYVRHLSLEDGLSEQDVEELLARFADSNKVSGTTAVRRACGKEPNLRRAVREARRHLRELSRHEE